MLWYDKKPGSILRSYLVSSFVLLFQFKSLVWEQEVNRHFKYRTIKPDFETFPTDVNVDFKLPEKSFNMRRLQETGPSIFITIKTTIFFSMHAHHLHSGGRFGAVVRALP